MIPKGVPFSIVIIFEHRTIKSWCSIPEDEQRLSASPFEEYFCSDTNGICSPEEKFYTGSPRIFFAIFEIHGIKIKPGGTIIVKAK